MSSIRRKLALVSHLKLLSGATSADPNPIPGYMYDEITKITFTSVSTCAELQDDLLSRLKKKSPHTKAKILKILKHLVEKGHEGFKQDLQRRTDLIRESMAFRGPADQMHGDTFNKLVRTSAEELMEALFDSTNAGPRSAPGQGPSVIKTTSAGAGYGSGAQQGNVAAQGHTGVVGSVDSAELHLGTGEGPLARSGRMVGFGSGSNEPAAPATMAEKLKAKVKQGAEKIKNAAKDGAQRAKHAYNERRGGGGGDDYNGIQNVHGSYQSGSYNNGSSHISSDLGSTSNTSSFSGYKPPTMAAEPGRFQEKTTPLGSDSAYEQRLVDEITLPAGVRAAPPKSALTAFVNKCSSLDCYKVASLLEEKLAEGEPDKTRIRALYVTEALLQGDIPAIHDCFGSARSVVAGLQSAPHSTIREMAIRVLGVMDSGSSTQASPIKSAPAPAPVAAAPVSLVDFGTADAAPAPAATGGGMFDGMALGGNDAVPAPAADAGGMFGGMDMTAAEPAPATGGMFAGMDVGGSDAAPAPAAVAGGMFGGMDMTAAEPASATGVAAPAVEGGMFSGMTMGDAPAAAPATSSAADLLGGLDLGAPAAQPAAAQPAAAENLLGDLLGGPPEPAATPAAPPAATGGLADLAGLMQQPMGMQQQGGMGMGMGMPQQGMGMGMQQQPMGGMGMQQQGGMGMGMQQQGMGMGMGMQQQPMMGGMGMQQQGGMGMGMQRQGMGMGMGMGVGMQQQPMMGGMGMGMQQQQPMGGGMGGSSAFGLSGTSQSPPPANSAGSNSFAFGKGGASPAKGGSDPFSFISSTVDNEAHKK